MANELKFTYASQVTLDSTGASCANAAFVSAASGMASAQHSNYPYADFVLMIPGWGTTIATSTYPAIYLWRWDQNIDSTNDETIPSASNKKHLCGAFIPHNTSTASAVTHYIALTDVPLVADQQFALENQAGVSLNAGWTLKATPKSFVPGA